MTMIKKVTFFISLLLSSLQVFGQEVMKEFPLGQHSYEGGDVQFYKDFHQIVLEKGLKPCENKNEFHLLQLVVYENATVKYVKTESSNESPIQNKCAFELSLEVIKYMDKWKPATFDTIKKPAITSFFIFPDALFDKYELGYLPQNYNDKAEFGNREGLSGGVNAFRAEVGRNVDLRGFIWNKPFKLVVTFVVNREGKIEQLKLDESSGNEEFDNRILDGIRSIRKKWNPGKIHCQPVNYRFRLPLNFTPPQ